MDQLKQLYDEVDDLIEKVIERQKKAIKMSDDYLEDHVVTHYFGELQALFKVQTLIEDMMKK
ncbi:hypothetical protein NST81_02850 [Bacillus sp. FSL W8-0223]|uniref:hypothetical protein n=1 Tax=Bacillus sp. FSL W8-0223 TaxID=2954595 RepID=UPI0030FA0735